MGYNDKNKINVKQMVEKLSERGLLEKFIQEANEKKSSEEEFNEQDYYEIGKEVLTKEEIEENLIPTGIDFIDKQTGGCWRGFTQIIGAPSGVGKTTLLRNMAVRMALPKVYGGQGLKVAIISLEMTKKFLWRQIAAFIEDENMSKWFSVNLEKQKLEEIRKRGLQLSSYLKDHLFIDDESYTDDKLANFIRYAEDKYDVVFVDYFQSLRRIGGKSKYEFLSDATIKIRDAARDTREVAVVMLSQITGEGGRAISSVDDLRKCKMRDCDDLKHIASWSCLLYKDQPQVQSSGKQKKDAKPIVKPVENEHTINVYIGKNRSGKGEMMDTNVPFIPEKGIIGNWFGATPVQEERRKKAAKNVNKPTSSSFRTNEAYQKYLETKKEKAN